MSGGQTSLRGRHYGQRRKSQDITWPQVLVLHLGHFSEVPIQLVQFVQLVQLNQLFQLGQVVHRDPGDDAGHALGGGWVGPCTWGQRGERWHLGQRGVGEAGVWSNRAGLGFCSTNIERDFAFTKYKFQLHLTTQGAKAVKQGEGARPWSPLSRPPVLLPFLLGVVDAERRSWRRRWWWRWWQPWCRWGWGSLRSVEKVEQATHDEALAERKVTSNFGTLSAMD